jgi:phosphoribosyl-AMP cyclohydrolase
VKLFKTLEHGVAGQVTPLSQIKAALTFNSDGLIPCIAQQHDSGEVLMMAWMNAEALDDTLKNNRVCYFSRSRQKLWRKGESSGQVQRLKEIRIDCDGDALLLMVDQTGPACHTGRQSCFYHAIKDDEAYINSSPLINPDELYGKK